MSSPLPDPFVYAGTNILINRFNIRDLDRLHYYEATFATARVAELIDRPLAGSYDLAHLQAIHRHIFQDIYPWAGTTREAMPYAIGKERPDGTPVSYPIGPLAIAHATKTLAQLNSENILQGLDADRFAHRLAHYYAELDYSHVFREGNSRTLRAFSIDVARQAGHSLTWTHARLDQESLYLARDRAAFGDSAKGDPLMPLAGIIREGLNSVPVMEKARADLDVIRAYTGDGTASQAPAAIRGPLAHLDRIKADIMKMIPAPADQAAAFERAKARVIDRAISGYKYPPDGADGSRPAPTRLRGRNKGPER